MLLFKPQCLFSGKSLVQRTCSSNLHIGLRKTTVCIQESRPSEGQLCFCEDNLCNGATQTIPLLPVDMCARAVVIMTVALLQCVLLRCVRWCSVLVWTNEFVDSPELYTTENDNMNEWGYLFHHKVLHVCSVLRCVENWISRCFQIMLATIRHWFIKWSR